MNGRPGLGFVGIGNMGWPMAANLARAGFPLAVYDSDTELTARFAAEFSCEPAATGAELAAGAEIVITMLPTGTIVRRALLEDGDGALAAAPRPGGVVIDMSSSEPIGTRELGEALAEQGVTLIDAPVSGGVPGAEKGTLAIMIGCDDETAVARVEPVLSTMGDRLFRTGPLGCGHAMKALNNYVAAAGFTAAAEALIIGQRFGLDPSVMIEVINSSTGRNFNTEIPIKDHVLTRTFATGFKLGLMAKDVQIANDLAESLGAEAPLSRLIREMWNDARTSLGEDEDFTSAIRRWEQANNLTVAPGTG